MVGDKEDSISSAFSSRCSCELAAAVPGVVIGGKGGAYACLMMPCQAVGLCCESLRCIIIQALG